MLGPPNAAVAGLARWRCGDQAVLRPDGDCWSDLSYYELPGSRPTRWMYENLMSFFSVLKNMLSARGKALALYKWAMKKAEHRDFGGAIADYTTVVQLPKGPLDLKAMAQLNRALAYSAAKEYPRAMDDLETLLVRGLTLVPIPMTMNRSAWPVANKLAS